MCTLIAVTSATQLMAANQLSSDVFFYFKTCKDSNLPMVWRRWTTVGFLSFSTFIILTFFFLFFFFNYFFIFSFSVTFIYEENYFQLAPPFIARFSFRYRIILKFLFTYFIFWLFTILMDFLSWRMREISRSRETAVLEYDIVPNQSPAC